MACAAGNGGVVASGVGDSAVLFENVTVSIGGVSILDSVTARVPRGTCTAVVGPNGAGKTTLLLALLGQVACGGRIRVSRAGGEGAVRIGYVPQRASFDRGLPLTVREFLVMGRQVLPLWVGTAPSRGREAAQALASVGAAHLGRRPLGGLSGGELQRVLLAAALLRDPDLLVLDEPAAGVDLSGEEIFCEVLDRLRAERGFTEVMVSHDLATVAAHADHVICLNRRVRAEGPPSVVLTTAVLRETFGLHMGVADERLFPADPHAGGACKAGTHA